MSESPTQEANDISKLKWKLMLPIEETEHYAIYRPLKNGELVKLSEADAGKTFIGNKNERICRFCGKGPKETTFKKVAHAIPQLLGNNRLFSYCECDKCNEFFSNEGEDDLAKLLSGIRTIEGFRGKKGVPVYKTKDSFRMEKSGNHINISSIGENFQIDRERKTLTFPIKTPKFHPVNVWRILAKMALSILPEEAVKNDFKELLTLIMKSKDDIPYQKGVFNFGYVTYPQTIQFPDIQNVFFIRKNDTDILPYSIYAVASKSIILFVMLLSPERDMHLETQHINLNTENLHKCFYRYVTDDNIENTPLHFFKVTGNVQGSITFSSQFTFTEMEETKL